MTCPDPEIEPIASTPPAPTVVRPTPADIRPIWLRSLREEDIPLVLELDQQCFGGLWSASGYQREIDSPNSDLWGLFTTVPTQTPTQNQPERPVAQTIIDVSSTSDDGWVRWLKSPPAEGCPEGGVGLNPAKIVEKPTPSPSQEGSFGLKLPDVAEVLSSPNSRIIGLGCLWAILEEAHITLLGIDPTYRRQGLGNYLLCQLLRSAQQRRLERATLEVRATNQAAIALYNAFGFKRAGCRRNYYPDGEDALILWRNYLARPAFQDDIAQQELKSQQQLAQFGWQPR